MKCLYVHPAIRNYREPLFQKLGEMGMHFLFSSSGSLGEHAIKETADILARFPYPYHQAREMRALPVSDFSLDLMRVFRYDLVIFSHTTLPLLMYARWLKWMGKRVLLFDVMWRYPHEVKKFRLAYPFIRSVVNRSVDAIIAGGSKSKAMYMQEFAVPEEKLFVAYETTTDLMQVPRCERTAGEIEMRVRALAGSRKVVLYLGRLVEYKGLDVLIRAMAQLPEDACLIVVGSGPFGPLCEQMTCEMGLTDRVHFLGGCAVDETLYYYLQADVFVLPARFQLHETVNCEAWGFTVNEAMSLEVPVVATTAVGAAFDLICDGETGMLAEENDADSLAAKINSLLADEARRKQIGKQGRAWLMERCRYEQSFQAYQAAIAYAIMRRERKSDTPG
ncbi:MAG TPA: glycosyltransferase family 4 protein [Chthonomonadaceae bacterium]|nr:glycosyltransferase family 4 protein [Chthonomonadaceae bacterium]